MHGVSLVTDEAVDFLMSPEHVKMAIANAILVDSKSGFYEHSKNILWRLKNINKLDVIVEIFDDEELALEWLSKYCNDIQ